MASTPALALDAGSNDVYVRVVDVGPGLCTVTKVPGGHYMVYDAGHWEGLHCYEAVQQIVGGADIDLLVISHADSDHLGNAGEIIETFEVHRIIRTGFERWDTAAWKKASAAIASEALFGASIMNLQTVGIVPGTEIELGDARVTLVAG